MAPDGKRVLRDVLTRAKPRPTSTSASASKNLYAVRFANAMAAEFAADLAPRMKGIAATPKRTAGSTRGSKQLDVNFSTPLSGLLVGISLKSVHIREAKGARRYTHNLKRNEEELRIEASGYHKRQPYAVMIGVLFLPLDSCDDGKKGNPSSFGSWVRHLRPFTSRKGPRDDADRFESIYVGLYEPDGSQLWFFDVAVDPPKNGRPPTTGALLSAAGIPRRSLTYSEFLDAVYDNYLQRNSADFNWADGTAAPLSPEEQD